MSINNGHDDEKNTAEECQHLCQQTDDCNVFTWDSERKWCWLKSGISSSIELEGAISGPNICGMSKYIRPFLEKGMHYKCMQNFFCWWQCNMFM